MDTPINITLPLQTLLDYLLTYRTDPLGIHGRFAAIDLPTAMLIKSLDTSESLCHVELGVACGTVWPIKLWRESQEKLAKDKARSEKMRANREILEAAKRTMISNILVDPLLGTMLDHEQVLDYVEKIITKRQFQNAKMWGCENLQELLDT